MLLLQRIRRIYQTVFSIFIGRLTNFQGIEHSFFVIVYISYTKYIHRQPNVKMWRQFPIYRYQVFADKLNGRFKEKYIAAFIHCRPLLILCARLLLRVLAFADSKHKGIINPGRCNPSNFALHQSGRGALEVCYQDGQRVTCILFGLKSLLTRYVLQLNTSSLSRTLYVVKTHHHSISLPSNVTHIRHLSAHIHVEIIDTSSNLNLVIVKNLGQ